MPLPVVVPIIAFVALIAAAQPGRRRGGWLRPGLRRPPRPRRFRPAPLLRGAERAVWRLLEELPLRAHAVCPKVRVAELLAGAGVPRALTLGRHVDFVLVDRRFMPLLVVELDGPRSAQDRQRRTHAALTAAGIPVVHLRTGANWRRELTDAARAAGLAAAPGGPLQKRLLVGASKSDPRAPRAPGCNPPQNGRLQGSSSPPPPTAWRPGWARPSPRGRPASRG